jgi:cytoskeleton protein RodZ
MNLQELGSLLKQERERRSLSVRDVMDATKISRRNLNALEDGEVKLLPHPVYLKGYVRNYARLVGLEPEPLAALVDQQWDGDSKYLAQVSEPSAAAPFGAVPSESGLPAAAPAPEAAPQDGGDAPSGSAPAESELEQGADAAPRLTKPAEFAPAQRRRLWPWILLLIVLLCGAGLTYQCQRIQSEAKQAQPTSVPADKGAAVSVLEGNATDANATGANATSAIPAGERATEGNAIQEGPVANATMSLHGPLPSAFSTSSAPASTAAAVLSSSAPAQAQPTVSAASIEVSRKAPAAVSAPAPASATEARIAGAHELVVIAKPGEICWVEVSEGQRRKTFTIRDGDSRSFEFSKTATVRLGNAGGVVFRLNGSHYPFDGQRGHTATVEIGPR